MKMIYKLLMCFILIGSVSSCYSIPFCKKVSHKPFFSQQAKRYYVVKEDMLLGDPRNNKEPWLLPDGCEIGTFPSSIKIYRNYGKKWPDYDERYQKTARMNDKYFRPNKVLGIIEKGTIVYLSDVYEWNDHRGPLYEYNFTIASGKFKGIVCSSMFLEDLETHMPNEKYLELVPM